MSAGIQLIDPFQDGSTVLCLMCSIYDTYLGNSDTHRNPIELAASIDLKVHGACRSVNLVRSRRNRKQHPRPRLREAQAQPLLCLRRPSRAQCFSRRDPPNQRPIIVLTETLPSCSIIEMQELLQKMELLKATVHAQQEQLLKLRDQKKEEHGTMFS